MAVELYLPGGLRQTLPEASYDDLVRALEQALEQRHFLELRPQGGGGRCRIDPRQIVMVQELTV
jgi:hypothetical protein